ncbi:hypothetical protein GCM10028807_30570 [Spirosoma daeguense]
MFLVVRHDLGTFNSRAKTQKYAIGDILKNYGSLPSGYYKLKYANEKALPTEHRENAIWYSESEEKLMIEVDINSGPDCTWEKVTRTVLEQAYKSSDSMLKVDSLSKPNQPTSQCLK